MKFTKISLDTLCDIQIGKTPKRSESKYWGKGHPWVSISDMKSKIISVTKEEITDEAIKETGCKIIKKGTLLMSFKLSIGKLAFAGADLFTNEAIVALPVKDKKKVYPEYLYYVLKSIPLIGSNVAAKGATLNKASISSLKIPLPETINDQIRVAEILSKVERLISQRKESINLLNELLKSAFLEMFGDPVRNEKKWKKDSLDNFVAKDCPLTYGIVQPGNEYKDGVPVVRPVDLSDTFIRLPGLKRIDPLISKKFKRTILKGGEILMCVRGTTGIMSIASEEIAGSNVTRGLTPIWFDKNILPLFAFSLLSSKPIQKIIQDLTYGVALKQINLRDLRKIQMIVPDKDKQQEFVTIASQIESLKILFSDSLEELQNLSKSTSQLAFKGELDLRKLEIDHIIPVTQGGTDDEENLQVVSAKENRKISDKPRITGLGNAIMENFYEEDIAALLKEHFDNFDFRFSEVIKFFENERAVALNYLASEELKRHRNQLEHDIKTFIFSCVEGKNPHLKLEQKFVNAFEDSELKSLNPRAGRDSILAELNSSPATLELEDISGIYFKIMK
jgi:type I restriction enzyme S subunit